MNLKTPSKNPVNFFLQIFNLQKINCAAKYLILQVNLEPLQTKIFSHFAFILKLKCEIQGL